MNSIFSGLSSNDFGSITGFIKIFTNIFYLVSWLAGIVSVAFIIYGGIRYILSAGNEKGITDAKNTILWAVIGLILSLTAGTITILVITNLGGTVS